MGEYFNGQPSNVGVLLGAPSGDLVDVDLDALEAVALADVFLPATRAVFGRASKRASHRLYVCTIDTEKFADVDKRDDTSMLVEIRSTGGQTVFPGSTHPSGEAVAWAEDGDPAPVEALELRRAVVHLACAAMLARHWPPAGTRHDGALAAAGFLARAGVDDGARRHDGHAAARARRATTTGATGNARPSIPSRRSTRARPPPAGRAWPSCSWAMARRPWSACAAGWAQMRRSATRRLSP